jgi:hypothetical protein
MIFKAMGLEEVTKKNMKCVERSKGTQNRALGYLIFRG